MNQPIKNCHTCAHRFGGKCLVSGYYWETQRKYPDRKCDEKFSGWTPNPPTRSLMQWFYETFLKTTE